MFAINFTNADYGDLIQSVKDVQKEDPKGIQKTNQGGWHSRDDLYDDKRFGVIKGDIIHYCIEVLDHLSVEDHCKPCLTGMWAMINKPGTYNKLHSHPHNFLSGAFYLQVPENSGKLTFHNPHPQSEVLSPPIKANQSIHLAPRVGWQPKVNDLLIFPSWLNHEVEINNSKEDRIMLSFNAKIQRKLN